MERNGGAMQQCSRHPVAREGAAAYPLARLVADGLRLRPGLRDPHATLDI